MTGLSYITPLTLYKGKTRRGTLIEVREIFGAKKLDLNGYPQSNPSYARNWKSVFRVAQVAYLPTKGKVLVLGLGGGNVARVLGSVKPSWHQTLVELEDEVVEIAKQYFDICKTPKRTIVVNDAKQYLNLNLTKHDLVIVDLYMGDDVPKFVTTKRFLTNVLKALKPGGMAIFNYASHSFRANDFVEFEEKLNLVFSKVVKVIDWGHTFYIVYK